MLREPLESGGVLDPMDPMGRVFTRRIDPEAGFHYRGMEGVVSRSLLPDYSVTPAAPDEDRLAMAFSLGVDTAAVPLSRYLPCDLYMDVSPDQLPGDILIMLMARLIEFCSLFGFDVARNADLEIASTRWRPTLRTKRRYTSRQVEERQQAMGIMLAAAVQRKTREDSKTKLYSDRELQKLMAELDLAKAETEQAKAETFKARAEGAKALAEILLKVGAGVSLLLGTLHFIAKPAAAEASAEPAKVVSMKVVDPATAFQIWSGDEHRDIVFVDGPNGLKVVSVAPPEAEEDDEGP